MKKILMSVLPALILTIAVPALAQRATTVAPKTDAPVAHSTTATTTMAPAAVTTKTTTMTTAPAASAASATDTESATDTTTTTTSAPAEKPIDKTATGAKDIDSFLTPNSDFSTFVTALKAAGWDEPLKGQGPYTVFAPTNEAFAKLPRGTVESLLKPENKDKLVLILKHHVIRSKVMAADAKGKTDDLSTAAGDRLPVSVIGGDFKAGDGKVTKADIIAKNGVIQVVDTVLMPKTK